MNAKSDSPSRLNEFLRTGPLKSVSPPTEARLIRSMPLPRHTHFRQAFEGFQSGLLVVTTERLVSGAKNKHWYNCLGRDYALDLASALEENSESCREFVLCDNH